MSIHDYLIDHRGQDWPSLFAEWTWLVPKQFTVWLMNRFGDLFLVFDDGSVDPQPDQGLARRNAGCAERDEVRALPTAEADRDDHPGFPSLNVFAGGPGSLAEASGHELGMAITTATVTWDRCCVRLVKSLKLWMCRGRRSRGSSGSTGKAWQNRTISLVSARPSTSAA